ncbi:MAG: hypothetical protein AAF739_01465 [Pseudomonadota bacterium]
MRINRKPSGGESFRDFLALLLFGGGAYWCFADQPVENWMLYGLASGGMACLALYALIWGYPNG